MAKPTARDILDQLTVMKKLESDITETTRKYLERLVQMYFLGCIKFLDLRGDCLNGDSFTTRSTYSDVKKKTKTSLLAARLFLECHKTVLPTLLQDSNLELIMERAMKYRLLCISSDPPGKNYDINNSYREIFKLQVDQLTRIPHKNVTDLVNANKYVDICEEIAQNEVFGREACSQQYIQVAPLKVDSHKTQSEMAEQILHKDAASHKVVVSSSELALRVKEELPGKESALRVEEEIQEKGMLALRVDSQKTTHTAAASLVSSHIVEEIQQKKATRRLVSSSSLSAGSQQQNKVERLINLLTMSEFKNESQEGITTHTNTMESPLQYSTPIKNRERGNWEGKLDIIQIGKKMVQDYMPHPGDDGSAGSDVTFLSVISIIDSNLSTSTFSGPRMVDRILNGNTVKAAISVGPAFPGREPGSLAREDFQRLERDPTVMAQCGCENLCFLSTQLLYFGTEYAFFGTTFMENKLWCPLPVDIYSMLDKHPHYNSGANDSLVGTLLTKYLGETVANNLLDYDVVDLSLIHI